MKLTLHQDYKEFLELLEKNKVEYLLVGGYAVATHGYVRYTHDIDFLISRTEENAKKMEIVLGEFGFNSLGISIDDLMNEDQIIQLGFPPIRIDILTSISGVDNFEECFANRKVIQLDGYQVNVISRVDLIKNKKASGRAKDLGDAEELEKA